MSQLCAQCNGVIVVPFSLTSNPDFARYQFCSQSCSRLWLSANDFCAWCSLKFTGLPITLKKEKLKFCCYGCFNKWDSAELDKEFFRSIYKSEWTVFGEDFDEREQKRDEMMGIEKERPSFRERMMWGGGRNR